MVGLYNVRFQGDHETFPVSLQLWLDDQGKTVPRGTTFGALGGLAPESRTIIPFVFFTDGMIDLGTHMSAGERYGGTNFHGRRVVVGELFTINWDDDGPRTNKVMSISPVAR